ncbi:MAG: 4Fe-4S dicluster domain-containing protein [Oscillospiraceae bacterium]|nr:4Fe-4S dicluster domain-containing protein [Oscillospiraceae bacterium]
MPKMTVDFSRCKGCGLCIPQCPKKIVELDTTKLNNAGFNTAVCVDDDKCIACALCAVMCPECAITVKKEGKE